MLDTANPFHDTRMRDWFHHGLRNCAPRVVEVPRAPALVALAADPDQLCS